MKTIKQFSNIKKIPHPQEYKYQPQQFWPQIWNIGEKTMISIFSFGVGWKEYEMVDENHYLEVKENE
ncbi:MAG: hypothetical protein ACOCUI_02400 [bacterium]